MSEFVLTERPKILEEKLTPEGLDELVDLINIFLAHRRKKESGETSYQYANDDEDLPQNIVRDVESNEIPTHKTKVLRKILGKAAFHALLDYMNEFYFNNLTEIRHEPVPDSEYGD